MKSKNVPVKNVPVKNVLKALLGFAGKKDTRYYLNAVHIVSVAGGGLLLESSDGHRALRVWLDDRLGFPDGTDIIVDRAQLDNAQKIIKEWVVEGLQVGELTLRTVDARYPDIARVVGRERTPSATGIALDLLLTSAKAISLLCDYSLVDPKNAFGGSGLGQLVFEGAFTGGRFVAVVMGCRM